MINEETPTFLKDLKVNNSKVWLDENRSRYDEAKSDVLHLANRLIALVSNFDKTISSAALQPKNCITRLNKDLRFAKDKTPYKTDYYIILNKNGKNSAAAFYYLHIEPDNCFVGGGVWNPQPEQLRKVRQEIDYCYSEWMAILKNSNFKKGCPTGISGVGVLSKVPKQYDDNNPASEFLKMKGFCTKEKITDKEILQTNTLDKITSIYKATKPLVDFLNRAIENE